MSIFYLIRHGECDCGGKYLAGRSEIGLNERGVEQATRLAQKLKETRFDKIISSPIRRTRETAEIIASAQGKSVILDNSFQEISYGEWSGKSFDELSNSRLWDRYNKFRALSKIPGGEMIITVQCRMVEGVEKLRRESSGEVIAIISHSDPIKSVVAYYCGIPIGNTHGLIIENGSVSILELETYNSSIRTINFT
ncbi:Phosphoglycerate mutase family protein [Chitinispirillum alkaliphilum]|nr:Phosphoglycerate mutase family protein [Chitinispirillum alkaliphilum]